MLTWKTMNNTPQTFSIVQYNIKKTRNRVMSAFFREIDPQGYHILAIQKPWRLSIRRDRHMFHQTKSARSKRSSMRLFAGSENLVILDVTVDVRFCATSYLIYDGPTK